MPAFTTENAAEMGRKGAEIANAVIAQRILLRELIEETAAKAAELLTDYKDKRLVRVRLQLDSIDKAILSALPGDSKKLRMLFDAQTRLNAQERELSMRPAPGTTKPPAAKSKRSSASTDDAPQPISRAAQVEPAPPPALCDPFSEV